MLLFLFGLIVLTSWSLYHGLPPWWTIPLLFILLFADLMWEASGGVPFDPPDRHRMR